MRVVKFNRTLNWFWIEFSIFFFAFFCFNNICDSIFSKCVLADVFIFVSSFLLFCEHFFFFFYKFYCKKYRIFEFTSHSHSTLQNCKSFSHLLLLLLFLFFWCNLFNKIFVCLDRQYCGKMVLKKGNLKTFLFLCNKKIP